MSKDLDWINKAEQLIENFAKKHAHVYKQDKRAYFALFEIGCFLELIEFYRQKGFKVNAKNLKDKSFRYLTTPNGNPDNFSYIILEKNDIKYQIRQQIRVTSIKNSEIYFTPDIVVLKGDKDIENLTDPLYSNGKRRFFYISSEHVIALHECKSLEPFPELFVSFIGMLLMGHGWNIETTKSENTGIHLAPSLFVGGRAKGFHVKLIKAYEKEFPINIITNMHSNFSLKNRNCINV